MKFCHTCGTNKENDEFHSCRSHSDGLASLCKSCKKSKAKSYYDANRNKTINRVRAYKLANPIKYKATQKKCYETNRDRYLLVMKERYIRDRESILEKSANYRARNKEEKSRRDRRYVRDRMQKDPLFAMTYSIRCRLGSAFRAMSVPKRGKTSEMIGCGWGNLKFHIESQFKDGMSWENRGKWHVDHIIPLASAKSVEDLERLCHYTNLQPLWAADNIRKGARIAA